MISLHEVSMDNLVPNAVPGTLPDFARGVGRAARRTTDSFSNFTNRLIEADVATALTSVITNIYVIRTILSLLIIVFGVICSVLYVRYNNRNNVKQQEQLNYVSTLWFGQDQSGLIWLLMKIWLSSAVFLISAPLLFKILEVWRG